MKLVYYFTADWCQPCKNMKPIVQEIEIDQNVKFQKIDVDYEKELVEQYGIRSVPTFILIENNSEVRRISGAQTRDSLNKFIWENE